MAVMFTDGRSRDDPQKAALRLRAAGVELFALGLGNRTEPRELELIAGAAERAFPALDTDSAREQFVAAFRHSVVGQQCEFLRGGQGVQVECTEDAVQVTVTMEKPFLGKLYVEGAEQLPSCSLSTNSSELVLTAPLRECGFEHQFTVGGADLPTLLSVR